MKKYLLVLAGCMLSMTLCFGQTADGGAGQIDRGPGQNDGGAAHSRWKFRSDEYLGMVSGEMGSYGMIQTVNGLYKGPWFLGLGTGLDYYRFRSVPLFLSVTRDIPVAPEKSGLFVLANGGINLPWYTRELGTYSGIGSSKFHPGIYWNTGLGYRWKLSSQSDKALLISTVYGVKKLSEHQVSAPSGGAIPFDCPYCQMLAAQTYDYVYMNRVWTLSIGFQF